eukprot:gnl/MRDRNA2_/MRDRNA2_33025_c0_seq1.p1 gnl/MRDRNA2_/MRDRNA2_33025_c0~~gnl/MRDRNA2_/MRDRNA2_33025_c0_seq1.p1  ORF type:complete len:255 (+),score=52.75 gnl/MRDRNA2_/MRDRNA2_33025_c0_seq1:66-830(+)
MADDDDDPMAFLAKKREQMAAMQEMAQVAQMQAQLASDVKDRMARISQLLEEPPESDRQPPSHQGYPGRQSQERVFSGPTGQPMSGDEEVDFWRRKIASLSGPVVAQPGSLPEIAAPPAQAPVQRGGRDSQRMYSQPAAQQAPYLFQEQRQHVEKPHSMSVFAQSHAHAQRSNRYADNHEYYRGAEQQRAPEPQYFMPTPASGSNGQSSPSKPPPGCTPEQEVAFWNRRISELSQPTQNLCRNDLHSRMRNSQY